MDAKIVKINLIVLAMTFVVLFSVGVQAYEVQPPVVPPTGCAARACPGGGICIPNPLCADTFEDLVTAIVFFLWNIALAIAPIMILIAGFLFITAAGNPANIIRAKQILLYTVVGIVIIGISRGLIEVIKNEFLAP